MLILAKRTWADPTRSARGPLLKSLSHIVPIVPVLPAQTVHKCCAVYNLRFDSLHGMEKVVDSIPNRRRAGLA